MKSIMIMGKKLLLVVGACLLLLVLAKGEQQQTCSANEAEIDPALKEMTYDVGDGPKKFMAYVEPDIKDFYNGNPPASTKVVPKFNGLAGKFINMSNQRLKFYWEPHEGSKSPSLMRIYAPFNAGGTGTFPGHRFFFTPENSDERLKEFVVEEYPNNLYVYDPYKVEGDQKATQANLKKHLTKKECTLYDQWAKTLLFDEQYKNFTGRSYLSNYLRDAPTHFMWRADYFGQEHWVTTKETHFVSLPPHEEMDPLLSMEKRVLKETDPRIMQEYRDPNQSVMNMTLKVISCAPRAFEIMDFLSSTEVDHITELAANITLSASTTGDIGSNKKKAVSIDPDKSDTRSKTRTSFNSWVPREKSPVIDAVYRRAADLLRIDEALFRYRGKNEHKNLPTKKGIAESLQLVHYGLTQEYTAHHDFGYTDIEDPYAGARFATLLLYLNEGMVGGATSFPRWVNAETFEELKVVPKIGKAVLFYSQLPDGNMDDFSQHAALPIKDGEKWLINLWVWDPIYET